MCIYICAHSIVRLSIADNICDPHIANNVHILTYMSDFRRIDHLHRGQFLRSPSPQPMHSGSNGPPIGRNATWRRISVFYFYLLSKGGYVFGSVGLSVCLSVCLFACGQHYSKSYKRIGMTFYGGVLGSTMKN